MARDRNPRIMITLKHVIQNLPASHILINGRLTQQWPPKQIILRKSLLNYIRRKVLLNVRLAATAITGVATYPFPEILLDSGNKWPMRWELESGECNVRCLETTSQRRGII